MSDTRFTNKDGSLTGYALACGYIERKTYYSRNGEAYTQVSLWREGNVYHVRAHEFNGQGRISWDSFDLGELHVARRAWRKACKEARTRTQYAHNAEGVDHDARL